jgi:excisionase family DNA binding protein
MTYLSDQEPLLLRIDDAAQRLSISRATMYRLIQRGEMPIVRIGSAVRVRAIELDLWVAGIRANSSETAI